MAGRTNHLQAPRLSTLIAHRPQALPPPPPLAIGTNPQGRQTNGRWECIWAGGTHERLEAITVDSPQRETDNGRAASLGDSERQRVDSRSR